MPTARLQPSVMALVPSSDTAELLCHEQLRLSPNHACQNDMLVPLQPRVKGPCSARLSGHPSAYAANSAMQEEMPRCSGHGRSLCAWIWHTSDKAHTWALKIKTLPRTL